jgi:signal peptidase
MKTLKNTISGIIIAVLFIAIAFFAVSLVPIEGNIKIKIVKSGSMEPTIRTGGIVAIKPSDDYKVGDIITFGIDTKDSIPTTHRIVSINGSSFYTKGDANQEEDTEAVPRDIVIGKVLFTIPYVGYVLDFARQPKGFIALIAIPAAVIVIYEVLAIVEEVKKMRNKKRNEL